jgi:hydrogenase maturation protease
LTAAVVIGVGNTFRRDDGVGPAVAAAVAQMRLPDVRVVCTAETAAILDAWEGTQVAVVVDAATGGTPGLVRHCDLEDLAEHPLLSSHELSLTQTYELARALGRAPGRLVIVSVDAADTGYGRGLSPAVAAAQPEALRAVQRVVGEQTHEALHQQP